MKRSGSHKIITLQRPVKPEDFFNKPALVVQPSEQRRSQFLLRQKAGARPLIVKRQQACCCCETQKQLAADLKGLFFYDEVADVREQLRQVILKHEQPCGKH